MSSFVVKAVPQPDDADRLTFDEKSMWRGKDVRAGDEIFVFAAEHQGGRGLCARGVVTEAVRGVGSRVGLTVKRTSVATRPLGRGELRPFRDRPGLDPETEDRPQALPAGDQQGRRPLRCGRDLPAGLLLSPERIRSP